MAKYRTILGVIEAIQFTGDFDELEKFVGGDAECRKGQVIVADINGPLFAPMGHWVVRGISGDCYSVSPRAWERTYQAKEIKEDDAI